MSMDLGAEVGEGGREAYGAPIGFHPAHATDACKYANHTSKGGRPR